MTAPWSGRKVMAARVMVGATLPAPCGLCGEPVLPGQAWVVGHIVSRGVAPHLTWEPSNWRPEHRACSNKTGQAGVIAKARAEGARAAGVDPLDIPLPGMPEGPSFPGAAAPGKPPPLPLSPQGGQAEPFTIPEEMTWTHFVQSAPDWLLPYLDPDENSSPPLVVSPLHPDAVGTHADEAIPWIESVEGKRLRWWQRLGFALKLQHDASGRLLKRTVVETAPRRAGKSVGLRGLALWRMATGPRLFGERQEIVHTGSDLAVCRKAQKAAWRWSERSGWTVTKGNGKEAIETPDDDVWYVRAQEAVYGWDTTLGMVDEGWDVKPDTVTEGLEPSLMGRQSPQLVMTSTSHRSATSTMRTALAAGLADGNPRTLVLWWGARPGDDWGDPEVWRAASPYWDEDRAEFVASMYAKALAGEQDPELDDPDPLRGFACQFLNLWNLKERRQVGTALVEADEWATLAEDRPTDAAPVAAAVESWFGDGVSLALAWLHPEWKATAWVSVSDHPTAAEARAALAASGYRGEVIVGASLLEDPAWSRTRTTPGKGRTSQAVAAIQSLIGSDSLRHDGGAHLTGQVAATRIMQSTDGPRVVSKARADAVKAAAWAAEAARSKPAQRGRTRMIMPSAS